MKKYRDKMYDLFRKGEINVEQPNIFMRFINWIMSFFGGNVIYSMEDIVTGFYKTSPGSRISPSKLDNGLQYIIDNLKQNKNEQV